MSTNGTTFTNVPGATSTTLSFPASAALSGNQYQAVFTNSAGSATTTVATLTVSYAPSVTTNPANTTVNAGSTGSRGADGYVRSHGAAALGVTHENDGRGRERGGQPG